MAVLKDTIKTTSSFFGLISNSLNSTRKSFSSTNNSINNIKKNITNNTKIKKDLFLNSQAIRKQREEASKRKEMEDLLESSKVSSSATNAVEFVEKSDSPPFTRLLNALGYVTAGWMIENIPTWIFIGKEFASRINKVSMSVYNLTNDIFNISNSFNRLLQNSFISIVTFDFRQFTEGSVSDSFKELTGNLQDFGNKLSDAFSVFSVPLTQSLDGTQRAPELGKERTQSLFPETPGPSSSSSRRPQLSANQRRALDIIAGPESGGSYNAMNQGTVGPNDRIVGSTSNSKTKIKKELTSMTIGEVMERQAYLMNKNNPQISNYGVYAAGKYQIIPNTMITTVTQSGLSKSDMFSPENQDILGLTLLKSQGIGAWTAGGSRYDKAEVDIINRARQEEIRYSSASSSATSSPTSAQVQPTTPLAPSSSFAPVSGDSGSMGLGKVSLPYSPFKPNSGVVITSVMGLRWGKQHNGWDISGKEGTPMYAYLPGVVTHVNKTDPYGAGYGWWIVWRDSVYGSYHFFGHMQKPSSLNVGDAVRQGALVGYMGSTGRSTGPHLHWEISKYPPKDNGQFTSYEDIGRWTRKNPLVLAPASTQRPPVKPAPTPAQVSPTASPTAQAQLTPPPERAAADLMIFTPAQDSAPPTAATAAATQLATPNTISDFRLLNNFIKNKLLLDLAYL